MTKRILLAMSVLLALVWLERSRFIAIIERKDVVSRTPAAQPASLTADLEDVFAPSTRESEATSVATTAPPLDVGPAFGREFVLLAVDEPDGAPLAGAVAHVWKPDVSVWAVDDREYGMFGAEVVDSVLVRARGSRFVADETGCIRVPRDVDAVAVLVDHGAHSALVRIGAEEPSPRAVVLVPRVRLDVHVHDPTGTPAPGIEIVLRGLRWPRDLARARTNASGHAELEASVTSSPGDDVLRVIAVVPEPVEKRVRIGGEGTQTVELVLPHAEAWSVTIVDDSGEVVPLWGELGLARATDDAPRPNGVGAPLALTATLVNGRATIAAPRAGIEAFISLGGRAAHWWIDAGHTRDVQLPAAHVEELLRLTLCDPDGSPAANRTFAHDFEGFERDSRPQLGGLLHTDERGRAAIALEEAIPAGGRLVVYETVEPRRRAVVDCGALRSVPGPRVVLADAELGLAGRVVDASGAPVRCANVWAIPVDASPDDRHAGGGATTDADGRFRVFGRAAARCEVRVGAWRDAKLAWHHEPPLLHWGDRDVELRVDPLGSIEGEVLVDRGASRPLRVEARWPAGSPKASHAPDLARTWRDGERVRFRFAGLEAGERDLVFTHDVHGSRRVEIAGVRVDDGRVTLDPRTAPLDLRGAFASERDPGLSPLVRFVDVDGAPIAEGLISCEYGEDDWGELRGWMDGSARLPLFARCAAYAPGFGIHVGDVPRSEPVTWVLEPEPTIRVELAVPERWREVVRDVRVAVDLEDGPFNITSRGEIAALLVHGRAEFACLMGGPHDVDVAVRWFVDGEEYWTRVQTFSIDVSDGARGELHVLMADAAAWERAMSADRAERRR